MRGAWYKGIFSQMVNPAANPVQKRLRLLRKLPCFSLMILWLLTAVLFCWSSLAFGAEARPKTTPPEFFNTPADFDSCVKLALRQSPFFTKSALEIEIRRLGEKDSKADFFPSFSGVARYYPVQPNNPGVENPLNYSFSVSSGNYNPLLAYLSLKANRVVTQIATLAHLKVISVGIERLGKAFLQQGAADSLLKLRAQAMELAQENLRYVKERQRLGEITPVEVQIASQELEVAMAEQKTLNASKNNIQAAIKEFLGLSPEEPLRLEASQAPRQVLGEFEPNKANLQDGKSRNFDVRIKKLTQELQSWNVTVAKMKFVPNVNLALESPNPLSLTNARGAFFSVVLTVPIFDGFKKIRDIDRQKKVLKQFASEETVKSDELSQKWRETEENLNTAASALRVAQAQAELARLKETLGETLYRKAEKDFSELMAARQSRVKAQMNVVKKALDYDLAVLELRQLAGDLVYHYVHESQFQK
jgi:outer membrane protein TolC